LKISKYLVAALFPLLMLGCSEGFKHSSRNNRLETNNKKDGKAAAWSRTEENRDSNSVQLRRLESITWDSVKHELKWEISKGEKRRDSYQPNSRDRYEINMDQATMTVSGKSRRFSQDEAANVRTLMDVISKYAVESTVWWENGQGDPVDGQDLPATPRPRTRPKDGGKYRATRVVAMQVVEE
jgi:hypothetical protein